MQAQATLRAGRVQKKRRACRKLRQCLRRAWPLRLENPQRGYQHNRSPYGAEQPQAQAPFVHLCRRAARAAAAGKAHRRNLLIA
jgi:hypothetical protein